MVDLEVLKAYGLDSESLKKVFNKESFDKLSDKVKPLVERIRCRVQKGRDFNFENYRLYHALDLAWDSPFEQITPTLLASLIDKGIDNKTVFDQLKNWGISYDDMMVEVPDPKTPGKNIKQLSLPAFFRIFVPLVRSYVTIRRAKLMNDRRLVPFFKFEPPISTSIERLRSSAITSRTEVMSEQYGYYDVLNQAVLQMLHYGECLQFPVEEWHREYQCVAKDSRFEGETEKGPDGEEFKKVVVKEGLRYHLPHPARTYFDRGFGPSTFNSDTGCCYGGYWSVKKFGDIKDNPGFWNLNAVGYEDFSKWMQGRSYDFFKNILQGCAVNFLGCNNSEGGTSKYDREKHEVRWYTTDDTDRPVILTEHFEKLIPKDNGLGDYPYPIWFRFVIAADTTILYAAPLPYCPVVYYGYDVAENRTLNASMSLEILPFQDQFSNLLSQYLLTVKQNLMNVSLLNTDMILEDDIKKIENWGEKWFRKINILRLSFLKALKGGNNPATAVVSHKFPIQDTTALLGAMRVILDTCERVLALSAQEVGQPASHEQTREEVRNISRSTSIRVAFTGAGVDQGKAAWKRQIYQAEMAYSQKEFYAQVPMEEEIPADQLEKLGFTYAEDAGVPAYDPVNRKARLKVNKTAIAYQTFSSDRDGEDRIDDVGTAQAMTQYFQVMMNNPMIAQAIGPDQAIKIANSIGRFAGFPRDFKLSNNSPQGQPGQPDQQQAAILQQVAKYINEVAQSLSNDTKQALGKIMDDNAKQEQAIQAQQQEIDHLSQDVQQLAHALDAANQSPSPVPFPPSPNALDNTPPAPIPAAY